MAKTIFLACPLLWLDHLFACLLARSIHHISFSFPLNWEIYFWIGDSLWLLKLNRPVTLNGVVFDVVGRNEKRERERNETKRNETTHRPHQQWRSNEACNSKVNYLPFGWSNYAPIHLWYSCCIGDIYIQIHKCVGYFFFAIDKWALSYARL